MHATKFLLRGVEGGTDEGVEAGFPGGGAGMDEGFEGAGFEGLGVDAGGEGGEDLGEVPGVWRGGGG